MKKIILFFFVLISVLGCQQTKKERKLLTEKPKVVIDTTKKGNIGEAESSLEITTRLDTILLKRVSKYWETKTKTYERFEYFDSLDNQYKQVDYSNDDSGFEHSYAWYDTLKEMNMLGMYLAKNLARIDSNFYKNGKPEEVRQRYRNTELTEYFNSHGVLYKKHIYSSDLSYSYFQQGNTFYEMRNDIPIEYAEWNTTSKTDFGIAMKLFYDSKTDVENRYRLLYNLPLK